MFYFSVLMGDLTCGEVNGPPVTDPDFAPCPLPGVGVHTTVPNTLFGNVFGVFVALVVTIKSADHDDIDIDEDLMKILKGYLKVAMCMAGKSMNSTDVLNQTGLISHRKATIVEVADVSPLFEPLDELPQEALNNGPAFYSLDCVSIISSLSFVDEMWEPGQNLLDCLKNFHGSYSVKGYNLILLGYLISRIEECGPVQELRFAVGQEVECFLGFERGWQRGRVNALWARHPNHSFGNMIKPYEVLLDGDGGEDERIIYAP